MEYYEIRPYDPIGYTPIIPCKSEIHNDLGRGDYDIEKGIVIKDWDVRNTIYFKLYDGILEDYMRYSPFILISEKLKSIFQNELNLDGLQFLSVTLKQIDNNKNTINSYYVLNILNKLGEDVIDTRNSKKLLHSYIDLALFKDKIKGNNIFRIKSYEETFVVSDRIKNAMEKLCKMSVKFDEVIIT